MDKAARRASSSRPAPDPGRELTIALRFAAVPAQPGSLAPAVCLNCQGALDVHQPDADLPDRMLATCEACKCWHLVDGSAGGPDICVILLPNPEPFRQALAR